GPAGCGNGGRPVSVAADAEVSWPAFVPASGSDGSDGKARAVAGPGGIGPPPGGGGIGPLPGTCGTGTRGIGPLPAGGGIWPLLGTCGIGPLPGAFGSGAPSRPIDGRTVPTSGEPGTDGGGPRGTFSGAPGLPSGPGSGTPAPFCPAGTSPAGSSGRGPSGSPKGLVPSPAAGPVSGRAAAAVAGVCGA